MKARVLQLQLSSLLLLLLLPPPPQQLLLLKLPLVLV